jgi:hypothetical protein
MKTISASRLKSCVRHVTGPKPYVSLSLSTEHHRRTKMALNSNTQVDPEYYAGKEAARIRKDYAALFTSVSNLIERFRALPKVINDEATLNKYGPPISEANELVKRLKAFHEAEKAPFLGGGRGVDNVFFGEWDRLSRRKEGNAAGAVNIAQARVDDYAQRLLEAEQAKRAEEARQAFEKQRKLDEEAAELRRVADDLAAAAARARKPENIEAHREAAAQYADAAAQTEFHADRAAELAEDARIDTLAKPADMVRTRLTSGSMLGMRSEPSVVITNVKLLNKEDLWPFLKEEHILMALKSYAKTKNYDVEMEGAVIGKRNKGSLRG